MTAAAAAFAAANTATASVGISWSDLLSDVSPATADYSHIASGGTYSHRRFRGFDHVGVSGGSISTEIDNDESITINFAYPMTVQSLSIAHLFSSGNHGNVGDESALIIADGVQYFLTADSDTSGSWTGLGTLVNDSPANTSGVGAWTVSGGDVFGSPVSSIEFRAANPDSSNHSDYGFVALNAIPAPGAAAVATVAAVFGLRRRRH